MGKGRLGSQSIIHSSFISPINPLKILHYITGLLKTLSKLLCHHECHIYMQVIVILTCKYLVCRQLPPIRTCNDYSFAFVVNFFDLIEEIKSFIIYFIGTCPMCVSLKALGEWRYAPIQGSI